jgi:F-box/WD-40 domain protein MET30
VPSERCLRTFFGHLEGIWALAADNLRVVSGAEDRMVKIWDPRTGKCERTFTGHAGPVTCVGLSGDLLVTGSEDCEIRVMEFGPTEE